MNGQAKVQLILELKNKMTTGLKKAKQSVNENVTKIKGSFAKLKVSALKNIKSITSEIPLIGKAFRLLKNPMLLATVGIIGIASMIGKATTAAGNFQHEFLPIQQLNLDKSQKVLNAYKSKILDVSMSTGQSANDTAKAFYDIQSATGLFGKDVADIARKVGDFSIATGAKMPDAVNQTVKAMKAFGLGVNDIDSLLTSNAKTVQVGITTFDELARVQTEYAGAAAQAGQKADTANKIFAAFTSIAKDSQTAATMTKTAFQGLTQANTIKGLKNIGIDMYDAKGNMRDLSKVLTEVRDKFKTMSPKAIDELINKIGGPEGLRNLFGKLKIGADDFFKTMKAYDDSKFDLDKALKNAHGDFNTLKTIVGNQLNTMMIKLGEKFLPKVAKGIEWVSNLLTKVYNNFDTIWAVVRNVGIGLLALKTAMIIFNIVTGMNPIGAIIIGVVALITAITFLIKKTEGWGLSFKAVKTIASIIFKQLKMNFMFYIHTIAFGIEYIWMKFKNLGQWLQGFFSNIGKAIALAFSGDFSGAKKALKAKVSTEASAEIEELKTKYKQRASDFVTQTKANAMEIAAASKMIGIHRKKADKEDESTQQANSNPFGDQNNNNETVSTSPSLSGEINKITGSAKQVKSITVNIDSFVKGGITSQNSQINQMSAEQLEEWFNNMMLKVVRNLELSY